MAASPPVEPGQLSPDGMWRWDGTQWVPVTGQGVAVARRSRTWIWWLAGGCALIMVLGIIGVGFGIYSLINTVQHGAFQCLPSDFPNYPGASVASENTFLGSGLSPGDTKRCRIVLESNDDAATVTAFYESNLPTSGWIIDKSDHNTGEITCHLSARPQTVGIIDVLARGQQTEIRIQLDS